MGNKDSSQEGSAIAGHQAALTIQVSDDGFWLYLHCADGISWAGSELFTWNRIVQIIIAANPDMFGDINEPRHQCFPESLIALGFNVPGWPKQNKYKSNLTKE
jgi:hypothetical protein